MDNMQETARKFVSVIKSHSRILICIKGSPDPDAMASSFALKVLCEHLGLKAGIISTGSISLPRNRAFVKITEIPIVFAKSLNHAGDFDAYAVLDHQSARIELPKEIPCAIHIDHHDESENDVPAEFRLIAPEAGSTCTIIAHLYAALNPEITNKEMSLVATSLMYGIQTDTDKYSLAGKTDYEALNYLSKYYRIDIFKKISGMPYSEFTHSLLNRAVENQVVYKEWLIAGVGYVAEDKRDSIAMVADLLLKRQDINTAVVFTMVEKKDGGLTLDASIRTRNKNLDLNDIIKSITPSGGARKFKGAYQFDLSYFSHYTNRHLLWEVVKNATVELLKMKRDKLPITEIKTVFKKLKGALTGFFR